MRILITGGAGFIGSHLALKLAQDKHDVRAVDNFDPYYVVTLKKRNAQLLQRAGVLIHQLDLAVDPLEGLLEEVELVIHCAAQPGNDANTTYFSYLKNNLHATVALVEALKGSDTRLIACSTSSVYGLNATGDETTLPAPVSPYGVTKLAAEAAVMSAVRRGELQACVLRYFSVFGPRERPDKLFPKLFRALREGSPFPLYQGSEKHERSFSYVEDIVHGTLLAVEHWDKARGEVFNLGTDEMQTTGQVLAWAQEISGKPLNLQKLPPRAGDQLSTRANIAKATRLLGYRPQVKLQEGMRQMWESLKL